MYNVKMFCRILIIIVLFFLPAIIQAGQYENKVITENNLEVHIDVLNSKTTGISRISVKTGQELLLHTGFLKIIYIKLNNQLVDFGDHNGAIKIIPEADGIIEIRYEGLFKDPHSHYDTSYGAVQNIIDDRGISLTGIWYPVIEGLSYYNLKVTLPRGYEAISEAEEIKKVIKNETVEFYFNFPYPLDSVNLIASNKYNVIKDNFKDIEIYAYFFHEDISLAKTYIEFTKKYLKLYENLIGKYQFKRFSIVENSLPAGYSMPTFTLLGNTVVRLPFIVETSLGHEILHQWFGNLVYVDYESGNWAEGLTTYLADHLYEAQKGKGWEYRKQILIDYESYVTGKNEFPLRNFTGRVNSPSKAIGYGKTAMVFHMLKNIVGENEFFNSLKDFIRENRFQMASWDDLKMSFEKFYGNDLEWFFRQWIDKTGMPKLRLDGINVKQIGSRFELNFNIIQKEKVYNLNVPLTIYSDEKRTKKSFRIEKEKNNFKILLSAKPEKIVIDENYDIARRLDKDEFPPVIARLLGDERLIISLPPVRKEIYESIIDAFKKKDAIVKETKDIKDSDIKSSSVVILGLDNPLIGRLYGKLTIADAGFSIIVQENPWDSRKVIGIFSGKSKDEVDAAFRKIFHYGKYSKLFFDNGRNIDKEIKETQRGMSMKLEKESAVVDISSIKSLSDAINGVADKKIIYIGEFHDIFAHHAVQLDIITGIYKKNRNISIGMEMFQKPFQKTLDDFIEGRIDEKEFLKKSEYFKRWGFDYNLYKPILDFAKSEKIPVVALNIKREIIERVSKDGIDLLSEEEKREIPSRMDFSDNEYRERLKKVFQMHKDSKDRNFDYFYQSQILWDETMSQSIDEFLKKNQGYRMVVLAGQGHLEYGSGIPKRTFRRNKYDYAIVLIDANVEKDIANYVIFPKPVEGITAPKLMSFLREEDGRIKIVGFPEESVSEKAGLEIGDIILFIDDVEISSIDDIKIHLLYKKAGETVKVKVLRKEKEMEFKVKL